MKKGDHNNQDMPITIGEMARKLGITVRTLQYYDKAGLLKPSATTAGGRRFYTKQDVIRLNQILSMKYLGFSLEDIKKQLTEFNEVQDVIKALEVQKNLFGEQIMKLKEVISHIDILQKEAQQMHVVDFDRYAKIIFLLQQKSDSYWLLKLFSEKVSTHISEIFSENLEEWEQLYKCWGEVCDRTISLDRQGINPRSAEAQILAAEWWNMVLAFTGGDLSLISELIQVEEDKSGWSESMKQKILLAQDYRERILEVYFEKEGITL